MSEKQIQAQMQMTLNTAFAVDQEIFEQYVGKEVVIDTPGKSIGGILERNGAYFIGLTLTDCKEYSLTIPNLQTDRDYNGLERIVPIPSRALSKSQIEQIVLLKNLHLQIKQNIENE